MEATSQTLKVELLTESYRISGLLPTGPRRLSDILNQPEQRLITLLEASTAPLEATEYPPPRGPIQVNLESVRLAIPRGPEPTLEQRLKSATFQYVEKETHEVIIHLPPFRINGYVSLNKGEEFGEGISKLTSRFLPIREALAILAAKPDVYWTNEAIIIDGRRVEMLWPADAP